MAEDFRGALLPEGFGAADVRAVVADYERMLVRVMSALADRFDPAYPFVNAKLDLMTGRDFDDADPIRGRGAVYGWIQGRGLEALAGHCAWFHRRGLAPDLVPRLKAMLGRVLDRVRQMRARNNGRLWFFMTPDGDPFRLTPTGAVERFSLRSETPYGFSDLFAAKGMFAAACYLEDADARAEALDYIGAVDEAIWAGRFENDQVPLDPKLRIAPTPDRHFHGPFMIAIGSAALVVLQGERSGVTMGLRLLRHELDHYVNVDGRLDAFLPGDVWEAIDDAGHPYRDGDGQVLSDPGHALECVGLALKFATAAKTSGFLSADQRTEIARIEGVLPQVLRRNFDNGFLGRGICKAFDLVERRATNTDLPWWNLPETMRAAVLCRQGADVEDRAACDAILRRCHNAFIQHFVRPDLHLMAYQTIAESGAPIAVIPATADADPGYHTGLSLIDALDVLADRAI